MALQEDGSAEGDSTGIPQENRFEKEHAVDAHSAAALPPGGVRRRPPQVNFAERILPEDLVLQAVIGHGSTSTVYKAL